MEPLLVITFIALVCVLGYFINSEILTWEELPERRKEETKDFTVIVERRIRERRNS